MENQKSNLYVLSSRTNIVTQISELWDRVQKGLEYSDLHRAYLYMDIRKKVFLRAFLILTLLIAIDMVAILCGMTDSYPYGIPPLSSPKVAVVIIFLSCMRPLLKTLYELKEQFYEFGLLEILQDLIDKTENLFQECIDEGIVIYKDGDYVIELPDGIDPEKYQKLFIVMTYNLGMRVRSLREFDDIIELTKVMLLFEDLALKALAQSKNQS